MPRQLTVFAGLGTVDVVELGTTRRVANHFGADIVENQAASGAPASITGTLAATEAGDSAAFSGSTTSAAVTGTLAATEAGDTANFSGSVVSTGALAATEAADTASFSGSLSGAPGSLSATEAPDTASFVGKVTVAGTLAATEGPDTAAFVASLPVTGTLAATEGPDAAAFSGSTPVTGTLVGVEAGDNAIFIALSRSPVFTLRPTTPYIPSTDVVSGVVIQGNTQIGLNSLIGSAPVGGLRNKNIWSLQ